jgi:hypothetical protein
MITEKMQMTRPVRKGMNPDSGSLRLPRFKPGEENVINSPTPNHTTLLSRSCFRMSGIPPAAGEGKTPLLPDRRGAIASSV